MSHIIVLFLGAIAGSFAVMSWWCGRCARAWGYRVKQYDQIAWALREPDPRSCISQLFDIAADDRAVEDASPPVMWMVDR